MAKSILFKAVIEGSGIVNFDSNDQKWLWNRQKNVERCHHDNVSFGKGRYYASGEKTDKGDDILVKTAIISADCIRHNMYEDNMFIHLPNIMHNDNLLLNAVATPAFIERGYLFARKDKTIWKRKSALAFGYAKAVSSSEAALETCSNSQPKTGENKTEEAAETSFFKREVRGDMKYEMSGAIDVSELAFLSLSDIHDRLSFDSDYADVFREKLSAKIGSEVPEAGFFKKKGSAYDIPEHGILLTQEQVHFLVLDILKRLARFNLIRTVTGTAYTTKLEVKFVNDPLTDTTNNPDGWVVVFNNGQFNADVLGGIEFDEGYTKVDLMDEAMKEIDNYRKKYGFEEKNKKKIKKKNKEADSDELNKEGCI